MRKNPPFGLILGVPADVNTKYVYGSGVGALNASVRRAQKRRASFVCCSEKVTTTPLVPTTYTVSYNSNGGSGTLNDFSSPYTAGSTVTVLENSFTRAGYTFEGWNTNSGGTGTSYPVDTTFTINANTTLYAQWIPIPPSGIYDLTYNANGGTGTAPAPTTEYSGGASVTVLGQGGFTRTNRLFGGWNTASFGGTGTYYDTTDILTMPYADTILYAQWYNPAGTDYQVIYNGNGSTGGIVPATAPYKSGQGVGISGNTGSLTKTGFTFYGWNTAANGLGTAYPITSNGFTMPAADVTLYAQWVDTSATPYTLTYFGNGNTIGTVPSATSYPSGTSTSVVSLAPIAKSGYTFLGWNTVADGSGINYSNNASIVMDSNKSLYAQWAGGVRVKSCPEDYNYQSISLGGTINDLYRDNTNNTMTSILQVKYSMGSPAPGAPYGTGNGPIDTTHTGNMLNIYSRVDLSQVASVYTFNILYVTNWRNSATGAIQTEAQTGTLSLDGTYWPTGQTIQDITITTSGFASFSFSCLPEPPLGAPTPFPQTSFTVNSGGCQSNTEGAVNYMTISPISTFYINFNNGTTTRVAIAGQTRWQGTANPYILNYNRTRIELANGLSPTTPGGTFPSSGILTTTSVNSSV
jgi:uncharacterized repeat protein (TIGR02543 family)